MALACCLAGGALTACAKTTIDPDVTEAPQFTTTTTLPTGSATELLPRLVTEAAKLSNIIGSEGDRSTQLQVILALFDAIRPEIGRVDASAGLGFDGAIELCKKAEQFKRPADADKCSRNLTSLADNYLRKHP